MLFSRRRLVFTNTQVYFQCAEASLVEGQDVSKSLTSHSNAVTRVFPSGRIGQDMQTLCRRIEEYYTRELSFDSDVLNAFAGIFGAFAKLESQSSGNGRIGHFYGIPIETRPSSGEDAWLASASMVQGLDWEAGAEPVKSRNSFPSWSWASIKSQSIGFFVLPPSKLDITPREYEIEVTLNHRDGSAMDITTFLADSELNYSHFYPWIDVTTLAFSTPPQRDALDYLDEDVGFFPVPVGLRKNQNYGLFLDRLHYRPKGSLTLLHLRSTAHEYILGNIMTLLIVEELAPRTGQFRRVGRCVYERQRFGELDPWTYPNMPSPNLRWEKVTLRLV
jgi:hypothetical protein